MRKLNPVAVLLFTSAIYGCKLDPDHPFPPQLINFVRDVKTTLCPDAEKLFLISTENSTSALENKLVKEIGDQNIVGSERFLMKNDFPSVDCAIIVTNGKANFFQTFIYTKAIVLVRSTGQLRVEIPKIRVAAFFNVYIFFNQSHFLKDVYEYPKWAKVFDSSSPFSRQKFKPGMLLPQLAIYTPFEESDEVTRAIWRVIADRYNISYQRPVPAQQDSMNAHMPAIYSLYRSRFSTCYIVPVGARRPVEYLLIVPFDLPTWICILATIVTIALLGWSHRRNSYDILKSLFDLFQAMIGSPNRATNKFDQQLLALFMIAVVILTSVYQSLITAIITKPSYFEQIDTLASINDTCRIWKKFYFGTVNFQFQQFVGLNDADSTRPICLPVTCMMMTFPKSTSLLDGKKLNIGSGRFRFSQARSEMRQALLGLPDKRNAQQVQFYSLAFAEAGLHHFSDIQERKEMEKRERESADRKESKPFGLDDLQMVWKISLEGWVLSAAVFSVEIFVSFAQRKIWRRKNKGRDLKERKKYYSVRTFLKLRVKE